MDKPVNQKAWLLVIPVFLIVAISAIIPLMTVVNYSVQDIFGPGQRYFVGTEWFQEVLAGRSDVTITSNVEASSLVQRFENMVWLDVDARNLRPFAYPLPQDDFAWINFVNSWVTLKSTEGFYDALEAKWMPN